MIIVSLFTLLLLLVPALGQQTIVYTPIHNITTIYGTWSSGSMNVVTGLGFAWPANASFVYPKTTGMSYSFTADGYYEIARYRMKGNGTYPSCITGVMNWCHGTYTLVSNGSIVMTPFGDGYQQIQDPCAAVSDFLENYNDTELYVQWTIYQDAVKGYVLQLYQFDGSPLPPMYQVSTSPNMLPTQLLRNVSTTAVAAKVAVVEVSGGSSRWTAGGLTSMLVVVASGGVASLLL